MKQRGRFEAGEEGQLTARQADVAKLLGNGMSDRQIADQLGLVRTVETHVADVLRKLNVRGRRELVKTLPRGKPAVSEADWHRHRSRREARQIVHRSVRRVGKASG
jgi:DNA-binding CsgD family transcriptional regulator